MQGHGRAARNVTAAVVAWATVWTAVLAAAGPAGAVPSDGFRPVERPAPRATDPCNSQAARPGEVIRTVPWQQTWLAVERVAPLATGAGQTVAVIDSGVDGTHPQLWDRVAPGYDVLRSSAGDNVDCLSHGTAVASLIAARALPDVGLRGLAPDARILPVRVTNQDPAGDPDGPGQPSAGSVARAVTWAASHGATVIEISPSFRSDDQGLHAAIDGALRSGIVVVAAAGDRRDDRYPTDPPSYPAAYPGVIGVGAVDVSFTRSPRSEVGSHVMLTAPGDGVVAATRIRGHQTWTGTSFAAAFVAATAALVRQAWPALTPQQVADRLAATADPPAGGQLGPQYGHGIVDPYRALTEPSGGRHPARVTAPPPHQQDPAASARDRWWDRISFTALLASGLAIAGLLLGIAVAVLGPRGKTRGWRPGRVTVPGERLDRDVDLSPQDETDLFAVPQRHRG